jgi:hypothetical protein
MNFLLRFLAIDVPSNTRLQSVEPTFRGMPILWLVLVMLVVLAGMAGVLFFYFFLEKGTLGWIRRILLVLLRWGLLLFLLILILRPMVLIEFVGERPQGVALLLDASESMGPKLRDHRLTDEDKARVALAMNLLPLKTPLEARMSIPPNTPKDPPRIDLVKAVLSHSELKLVDGLKKLGPLRTYYFGNDVRGLKENDESVKGILAGLKAEDSRTALADAIVKIVQSKDVDPPAAIVVMTDGQDNASKFTLQDAAEECRRARIPLHIYGVGSAEGGQLQLKEIGSPAGTLFVEDHVNIPLRWRAQGFKKGTVEITLTLGGVPVGKKDVQFQTGEDLRDSIDFIVPKDPEKRETQDLVATIKYRADGQTFEDRMTRTVRVVDTKIRILYVEHGPRWEFKFLQPALANRFKKRCEVDFILINAAPEVAKGGPPYLPKFYDTREKFLEAKYNVIILGDVAPSETGKGLTKEQQEWIKEFVENRGGLIVMAGRQNMPSKYDEKSPIAEILPVEYKKENFTVEVDKATQEYMPTLTDAGQRTDWLSLGDTPEENLEVWEKKLVGFHWFYPVTKLKPAATSLIANPRVKMGEGPTAQPMPILATHLYGKGRVVWLGTDETWRWRWNYQDKYFDRFWGQLIYQLGSSGLLGDGAERTQIALNRSQAVVGTQSTIHVTLLDKDFNPRKDPKVEAELEFVDAKPGEERRTPITLNLSAGGRGEYTALIPHQRPGRFELHVKNPEVNTFSFRVDLPPKHELEQAGLAERPLRDAAQLSGGRFYREEDLSQLVSSLEPRSKEFTRRQEVLVWNPLAILIFLFLITLEWVVRKFSDLS